MPSRYDDPDAAWANRCFTVAQVWLWDELFFDFDAQRFTPERFLADARERFGGLDGVVLWHAYPVIGIDERNQWDYYAVPGLEDAARVLRDAGVAVFVDYNPWDTGTRRGGDDAEELAAVIRRLGADGVFLDTLKKANPELVAALDAARPGIGLEGESKLATERIADHTLSWAAVVRRLDAARRAARSLVRAPSHAAPHPTLASRPLRRAAVRMAERRGRDGVGGRLRRLGRMERAAALPAPQMSAYTDVRDLDGLAASCASGRALGFLGRTAIHPAQLPVIRAAFTPSPEEVARAREIVERVGSAAADGSGTVVLADGTFLDVAMLAQARRTLALAAPAR